MDFFSKHTDLDKHPEHKGNGGIIFILIAFVCITLIIFHFVLKLF